MGDKNEHKVNIKARVDRHSRVIKENLLFRNKIFGLIKKNNNLFNKILFVFLMLFMPVYPMFAGIIHGSQEYNLYRNYIDEDSILASYEEEPIEELSSWEHIESDNEFVMDTGLLDDNRNYEWTNEIKTYIVKPWDSISVIASKFHVSQNTILEYNNLSLNHKIRPKEELKIPPVSGIPYKVKSWDSLLAIANKYKIEKQKIIEYNSLEGKILKVWQELFLPWAKKIKPKYVPPKKTYTKKIYTKKSSWKYYRNQYSKSKWVYKLRWHKPYSWAWWNCTYYVASYKKVNWRWNANQWMRNAAKKWHIVKRGRWFAPKLWAIIVFSGRWYNPYYGHVGIVMELKKDYMIISDMNYRRKNEVTYRRIRYNDRAISWYIYVD